MVTLLFAEVAGIQDWIEGNSTELQMIRGGSELLRDAFERATDAAGLTTGRAADPVDAPLTSWRLIASSSGRLSMEFADAQAAELAAHEVMSVLTESLEGLVVRVGTAPMADDDRVAARIASRDPSRSRLEGALVPAGHVFGADTCDATGTSTASRTPTNEGWHVSAAAQRRRRLANRGQTDVEVENTKDMTKIGEATLSSRYGGYVGVVSADGNAVGARFLGLRTPAELRAASEEVHAGMAEAVAAAIEEARTTDLGARGEVADLRVKQVVAAGDDVRFVVPAHLAVPFATALTSASPTLQACAGVLLCHASLPYSLAAATAEDLLEAAKREARSVDAESPPAHVALARSAGSAPDAEPWDELHASPYTADELTALWEAAVDIDGSTSSVRNVVRALRRGGRAAEREWALWRLTSEESATASIERLWQVLGADSLDDPFPVQRVSRGGVRVSPLADLIVLRALRTTPEEMSA